MKRFSSDSRFWVTPLLGLFVAAGFYSPQAAWVNATGNLAGQPTECGDIHSIWAIPGVNKVITGVANNGIFATGDNGVTWSKISGTVVTMRMKQMYIDPANANIWYVGGIYHTPGICKSTDAGATWVGLGNLATNDGFSVDFSDPQRKTILAGGHEASNILWKSTDAGQTWTNIGGPSGGYSSFPYIINTQTYLMGIQGTGVFRSTDAGSTWTKVCSATPTSHFTRTSTGEFFFAGSGKAVRGSSDGLTWTTLSANCYNDVAPIEIPGGKIAAMNSAGIVISADNGATWKTVAAPLPSAISSFWAGAGGLTYNAVAGCFYTFQWACGNSGVVVGPEEIWRFDTLIGGGSNIVKPARTAVPGIITKSIGNTVYDIAGRSVRQLPFASVANRCIGNVYLLRNADGTISRKVVNR